MSRRLAYWTVINLLRFAYGLIVSIRTLRSVHMIGPRVALRGLDLVHGLEAVALRLRPRR